MSISRVRTVFTGVGGSPYYSNLYFRGADASPVAAVNSMWASRVGNLRTGMTITTESEVAVIDEATGNITSYLSGSGGAAVGSSPGPYLPPATQLLLRLATAGLVNNRRVKGRVFVPGLDEGMSTNNGTVDATGAALFVNSFTQMMDLVATNGSPLVVWSKPFAPDPDRPAGEQPAARAGSAHNVTAVTYWSQWAVQRRRRD
jgi:hypothetical protein